MDATVAQPLRIQEVSTVDHGNYWINGLLQGLARSELYLNRGGAPTLSPTTRQIITGSPGTEGLLSQLRRWGINTWADLLTPEGTLTTKLRQLSSLPLTLPPGLTIEPPLLRQGQFWYRTDCLNGITTVIEIMSVSPTQYQYREWSPTVQGMRNEIGRQVEWTAVDIATQAEKWSEGQVHQLGNLTHRLLMGERSGFGSNRWCRTIQGAYRSLRPELPPTHTSSRNNEAIIEQLKILHSQLYALGDFTMYTDGGWEYGGDGMDAPFYPYTDSPSHKGGGSIVFITKDLARI